MVNVFDFGATGDGKTDDTEALQHALEEGDGAVHLKKGTYRITRPLVLDLTKHGFSAIRGKESGTSRIVVVEVAEIILRNVRMVEKNLIIFHPAKRFIDLRLTVSNRFYLGSSQCDPGLEPIPNLIISRRLCISNLRESFLTFLIFGHSGIPGTQTGASRCGKYRSIAEV